MFASPFQKAPRHRHLSREDLDSQREQRKLYRRKSDTVLFVTLLTAPVVLLLVYELGHTMLFMQNVKSFSATIDQRPPAEVKRDMQRYAEHLSDFNPAIRNASMMAMKVATGWNPGNTPGAWRTMWAEQEPYWEYRGHAPKPAVPDWRSNLSPAEVAR